jgi:peptide-methionine (S)-S-oxide reductase
MLIISRIFQEQSNVNSENLETITLGAGCFWCVEAVFNELQGVRKVVSGYAGGHLPSPTYREMCDKNTGHAEVVQIKFDPQQISLRELLDVFFTTHDPTTRNQQGADVGSQYRSIILYQSPQQKQIAEEVTADFNARKIWAAPIVTEIKPLEAFYPAEPEHLQYYQRNPDKAYCRIVIEPKVAKLRNQHMEKLRK